MKFKNEVKYFKDFSSFLDKYFLISSNSRHEEWRNINVKNETKSQRMLTVSFLIAPLLEIIEFICRSGKEKKKEQEMFGLVCAETFLKIVTLLHILPSKIHYRRRRKLLTW